VLGDYWDEERMLRFEVFHNGKPLGHAGVRKGVLSAIATWVSRKGKRPVDLLPEGAAVPGLEFRVGGLNTAKPAREEHVDWVLLRQLRLGDELRIRVDRGARVDKPVSRERSSLQRRRRHGVELVRCSFCGKDRPMRTQDGRSGGALGAEVLICCQCLALAAALIEYRAARVLHLVQVSHGRCSFCARPKQARLAAAGDRAICRTCIQRVA
jgi:hypothetical protein